MKKLNKFGMLLLASQLLCAQIASANERIIISGNHITEIVFALGAGKQVVGADKTSTSPEQAKAIAVLGHPSQLSIEGILSLNPTLFISDDKYLNRKLNSQLEQASVETLILKQAITLADLKQQIKLIALALDNKKQGAELIARLEKESNELSRLKQTINTPQKALFLFGKDSLLIAGENTSIDRLLAMAGIVNAAGFEGMKPMTPESVIISNPDLLITVDKALAGKGQAGRDRFFGITAIAATPAGKNKRISMIPIAHTSLGINTLKTATKLFTEVYGKQ
ncbi:MAG: ABC transporter substrate-binding protein [Moritella sp.]|uniref:heme/hemin ABC transporter substrate-binding protein n=1 Tax=Moritella sp. TaxID=78556 RepID=UPI0025DF3E4B|nr:ABC transporter substrate-binding protein [Moritella sp.]NQZ92007.1 ABC transporter substrate-binding protein [Moritella sp.]